jgi:hypothetical protein
MLFLSRAPEGAVAAAGARGPALPPFLARLEAGEGVGVEPRGRAGLAVGPERRPAEAQGVLGAAQHAAAEQRAEADLVEDHGPVGSEPELGLRAEQGRRRPVAGERAADDAAPLHVAHDDRADHEQAGDARLLLVAALEQGPAQDRDVAQDGHLVEVVQLLVGNECERTIIGDAFSGSSFEATGTRIEAHRGEVVVTHLAAGVARAEGAGGSAASLSGGSVSGAFRLAAADVGPGAAASSAAAGGEFGAAASTGPWAVGSGTPGARILATVDRVRVSIVGDLDGTGSDAISLDDL